MKYNKYIVLGAATFLLMLAGLAFRQPSTLQKDDLAPLSSIPVKWNVDALGADFLQVDVNSSTNGWGLTLEGELYQFNGSGWEGITPLADTEIHDLASVSDTMGWAVGMRPSRPDSSDGAIWQYDGQQWKHHSDPGTGALNFIDMVSANLGWIVGDGALLRYNGTFWQILSATTLPAHILNISAVSTTELWAVTTSGVYKYNGASWQLSLFDDELHAIAMSTGDGWAVGKSGKILKYNRAQDQWDEIYPHPTTENLYDIHIESTNNVWAAGHNGTIAHYTGSWSTVSSGTTRLLLSISFASATEGWIGGLDSTLLEYNGSGWTPHSNQITPAALTSHNMQDLTIVPATSNAWAVGFDEFTGSGSIWFNNGSGWNTNHTITKTLLAIDMVSSAQGWAVGGDPYNGNGVLLEYNGSGWMEHTSPTTHTLMAVDAAEGWAGGGDFSTHNGTGVILRYSGGTWAQHTITTHPVHDIDMVSSSQGWAVGDNNTLLQYNGVSWNSQLAPPSGVTYHLAAVNMVNATTGWAVGAKVENGQPDTGVILQYSGGTWSETTVSGSLISIELRGIEMLSATEGWAVGDNGTILYYNNGGWAIYTSGLTTLFLNTVAMVDSNTGFSVGRGGLFLSSEQLNHNNTVYLPLVMQQPTPSPTPTPPPDYKPPYLHWFSTGLGGWYEGPSDGATGGDCSSFGGGGYYNMVLNANPYANPFPCFRAAPSAANRRYGTFQTQVSRATGTDTVYGLYINGRGGDEYYMFVVRPDSVACGWEFIRRERGHNDIKRSGGCNHINVENGWNTLAVRHDRSGDLDRFFFYINGQQVGSTYYEHYNYALRGEGTGLASQVRSPFTNAQTRFRYFQAETP